MKRKTEFEFPVSHRPGADKYFLRLSKILEEEGINPRVRQQVFIRKPGIVGGIDEAIAAINHFSPKFAEHGGKIWALNDGDRFESCETLMYIDGQSQDFVELETDYLQRISGRTSKANGLPDPDPEKVKENASAITDILRKSSFGPRACGYFGARHFAPEQDAELARAAYDGGFKSASTDIGAGTYGQKGGGTTPHAATLIFAMKYGIKNYAAKVMEAFDKHIDSSVPRVFLADTFNKEITDTLAVAEALGEKFWGPRFDTNGANVMQGGDSTEKKYLSGKGVTVLGVLAATKTFKEAGYKLENALTSGFSNPAKTQAFVDVEEKYNMKLFGFIGAGFSTGYHTATADIMGHWDDAGIFHELHKIGRPIIPNQKLQEVDLSDY